MDRELVEKVTRMVISELETHAASFSETEEKSPASYTPLTDEELEQWKNLSAKLSKSGTPNAAINENVPLTDEEMDRWKQLNKTTHFTEHNQSKDEAGTVRFSNF